MDRTHVLKLAPHTTHAGTAGAHEVTPLGQLWHFARHYLEMCAAMCIGGVALNALFFVVGPEALGYPDLRDQAPGVALVIVAVLFTLPMAAWMRIRGMAWGPTLEMSYVTVGLAVTVAALFAVGVVPDSVMQGLFAASCGPWCVVMLIAMLFRLRLYTGRTGHH